MSQLPSKKKNSIPALASAIFCFLAFRGLLFGQFTQPNFGSGSTTLVVQVISEEHGFLDLQALVRVRNVQTFQGDRWDTTHLGSETSFPNLAPGSYDVEVSAAGFHASVTRVDLYGAPTQTIQVVLRRDGNAEVETPPTTGISRKAREESERGILLLQAGQLKEAEKHFRKALKEAPENPQVNYLLGIVLLQSKQTEQAQQYLEKATTLDPRHVQALIALGGLRLQQKDYAAAAHLLEQAVSINSRQWRAHWLLANVRLSQQEFAAALTEAQLAIELSKNSAPYATLVAGEALNALGRWEEAVASFRKFLKEAPASPDIPAVTGMIAAIEDRVNAAASLPAPGLKLSAMPLRNSPLVSTISAAWQPAGVDDVLPPIAAGVACPLPHVLEGAGDRMKELVDDLDHFSATQTQVHERLDLLGKPIYRESRKGNYVAAISTDSPGWLQLREYRQNASGLGRFSDGISTHGLLSLALIFHPTMQPSYEMTCEGLGEWKGQPTWLVHFRQQRERPRQSVNFEIGRESHPLALKGRAWIAAASLQIVRIEAELLEPMPKLRLLTQHEVADYGPVAFKKKNIELWLPKDTQTYLDYRGIRYRLTDQFDDFILFSVESHHETKAPN